MENCQLGWSVSNGAKSHQGVHFGWHGDSEDAEDVGDKTMGVEGGEGTQDRGEEPGAVTVAVFREWLRVCSGVMMNDVPDK